MEYDFWFILFKFILASMIACKMQFLSIENDYPSPPFPPQLYRALSASVQKIKNIVPFWMYMTLPFF